MKIDSIPQLRHDRKAYTCYGGRMRRIYYLLLLTVALPLFSGHAQTGGSVRTFSLEGVRSGRLHGPFLFVSGTSVMIETGSFRLDVLSAAGSFILTDERTGTVFGVYDLVAGRMIDAGYQLFTITRIGHTAAPAPLTTAPQLPQPPRHTGQHVQTLQAYEYKAGISMDLVHRVAYNWELDGESGGAARSIERRGATLLFSRGVLTLQAGLLADGEWNETVNDAEGRFLQGTLSKGTGWMAGAQVSIPVFTEGRWSVAMEGGLQYQRESFSLEYGTWEERTPVIIVTTNETSNGVTNSVIDNPEALPGQRFVRKDHEAILSETLVHVSLRLDYTAPGWFLFAGLHTFPWSDAKLDARFAVGSETFPLTFQRRDPVSGYTGAGFRYHDLHCYAEVEAGSVNAIRLGLFLVF
jgi:hypothetical protein